MGAGRSSEQKAPRNWWKPGDLGARLLGFRQASAVDARRVVSRDGDEVAAVSASGRSKAATGHLTSMLHCGPGPLNPAFSSAVVLNDRCTKQ